MNGLNRVIIVGTLGSDPESHTSREGKTYASLSLATNRFWRNKEGTLERKTDWHRVTVWGKQATICRDNLKKGRAICVEGSLSNYEVEDKLSGQKRWLTSIVADDVNFIPDPNRTTPT